MFPSVGKGRTKEKFKSQNWSKSTSLNQRQGSDFMSEIDGTLNANGVIIRVSSHYRTAYRFIQFGNHER